MPNRQKNTHESYECIPCKTIFLGILIFIVGLMLNLGYTWDVILILLGIIILLKGIFKEIFKNIKK